MRDLATKVDASSTLTASEFNTIPDELENFVEAAGITLDAAAGPDNDLFMLAKAVLIHVIAGSTYQDNGAANTFVLAAVQANFQQPAAYQDGMTVRFKAAATNTGACTINVVGLGAISFTKAGGGTYAAGEIVAGNNITAIFFQGTNRFEEVANTTPEASGPAAPNQIAIYADSGSASQITLTIEPGFNQPSAFTDQMAILFKANATNDGAGTHPVNVTGLGAKDLVEKDGSDPIAGRITADDWVMAVYREVRDEFEIAFVHDNPTQAATVPATVSSSSTTLFNLTSVPEVRAPTSYEDGMVIIFRAPQKISGPLDVNLNGIGVKDIRRGPGGSNLVNGEVESNAGMVIQFDAGNDFFRIVSNGTKRGRVTRAEVIDSETIASGGETRIEFKAPARDDQELYNAPTRNFTIPANRGIQAVNVSVYVIATLPTGTNYGIVVRRTRSGVQRSLIGGNVEQGLQNNNFTGTAINLEVQDDDVIDVFAATSSPTAVPITVCDIGIEVTAFEGDE